MSDNIVERVRMIQSSMVEAAGSTFSEWSLDHLRVVVRLTVEFHHYLQRARGGSLDQRNVRDTVDYAIGSIFSGIDSFCGIVPSCRALVGSTNSRIQWDRISPMSIREEFLSTFAEFELEEEFEGKCRLLLDLFKLQIVFAGMFYE